MFVNERRDNWHELLPFAMHAYHTSVHESTGYSQFRLMKGEECLLPQDVTTDELRTHREHDEAPHPFATWVRDALEVAHNHVRHSLQRTAARRKRLYDVKAVNPSGIVGFALLPTSGSEETGIITDFPTSHFQIPNWLEDCCTVLTEIYGHLCINNMAVKTAYGS